MKNYSLTTTSLYAMAIAVFLNFFDVEFLEEEIVQVITGGVIFVGWIGAVYGRLRIGDLNIFGKRKGSLN